MPSNLGLRVLLLAVCVLICIFLTPQYLSTTMGLLRLQMFGPVEAAAAPVEQTTVRKIDLPGNDLVVDPNSQTIYVSVPSTDILNGNKIAPLNPVTGTIGSPMFVGSEPNRMAISDNGRYIYVILDGALAVRRLDLLTRIPDLEITFGNSGSDGPIVPLGLAVQPGQPEAVAIARAPVFNVGGVAVYDNGIQRPAVAQPHAPNLVFSTVDSTRLYSVGAGPGSTALTRFNVGSNGVTSVGQSAIAGGGSAVFSGGRLYVSSGPVVDPETGTLLGTFTAPNMINTIAFTVDQNVQRAYFLTSPFSSPGQIMTATLRVFDIQTFTLVGTVDIPNIIGRPTKLVRWGSNGLAFCSDGGFVHLIQTTLIPSPDPVPTPTPAGTPTPTPTPPIASAFVRVLSLPTSDLIYHPNSQKLYASTPSQAGSNGNSVVPINPTDGTLDAAIFVGSEPSKLARSDDGQFLYVGLDGAGGVRRVNVATQTADLQFSLGTSHISSGWPNLLADIEVAPDNAHTVAVSMRNTCCSPTQEGIAVFDDGTRRGPVFIPPSDRSEVEFSPDGTTLYVLDSDSGGATFRKLGLTPTGIVSNQVNSFGSLLGSKMEFDSGRLYFGNGAVASPEEPRLIGKFRTDNLGTLLVLPDSSVGRTFFINGAGFFDNLTTVRIVAFDQATFLPVGAVNVSGVNGSVRTFVRWGVNGLAFTTSSGQIFLIQTDLVATTTPVPTPTPTPSPTATPTPSPIPTPSLGELRQLLISTNDLVVDPNTQTLFASVPSNANSNANTLAPIDPVAGTVGTPIPVGNNPNKLAISDNGAALYVSLDGTNSVRQVDVASRQPGVEFSLGGDPVSGPYQAEDLAVAPNHPETVAVARMKSISLSRHAGVVIFDNGILRGSVIPNGGNNRIEFSRSPEILYGQNNDNNFDFGFRRIAVSTCGALTVTTTQNLFRGFNVDFKVDNGIAVSSDGRVIDAEAGVLLGVLKLVDGDNSFPPPALVAPELKARRIYFLLNDLGSTVLRVFDTVTFLKVGELQIPGVSGTPSSLVRWGTNGLAFRTSTGQLFLLQNSLIGGNDPQFTPAPVPPTPTTRLSVHVDVPQGNAEGISINMTGGLNATGVTDTAGNVSFNNIPICVGNVTVTPSKTSYAFAPASITVTNPIDANLQFIGVLSVVGLASGAQVNIPESADRVTVAISRNNNFPSPVGVTYETIPNSASDRSDFTSTRRTIQFGPDETFKTISVLLTDDALVEGTESFTIKLTDPFGAELNPLASSVTVNIIDNDTAQDAPNPLSNAQFFVRQHYQDFLNRAAADDPTGFNFWTNEITMCNAESDALKKANCLAVKRINVSAAFFLSIEFQETGYLVHRFYTSSFPAKPARPLGLPRLAEFLRDTQEIGAGVVVGANGWEQKLEQNKQAFALSWVARDEFVADHPLNQSAAEFVDSLFQNNSATPTSTERAVAITAFGSGDAAGRAAALRSVAESQSVNQKQNSPAFVLMQYFGYLRRNPDDAPDGNFDGYQFWLNKLNQFNGDFVAAEMVKAFLRSFEYQERFGQANFDISQ